MEERLKVGLAIGGGAAYGLSAIGVLRAFEENEIPIDVISGTSIGSVIGALYASGMKSHSLESELQGTQWGDLLDFVLPKEGLVAGKKVENYIRELIKNKTFEELKIPLYITAVDINQGRLVVFHKGDVASAVRASMSIPGVFTPIEVGDMTLVDGGIIDPVPTDVLKKHSDIIIAIDFSVEIKPKSYAVKREKSEFLKNVQKDFVESEVKYAKRKIPRPFRWLLSPEYIYNLIKNHRFHSSPKILEVTKKSFLITQNEVAKLRLQLNKPDVLIKPNLRKMNWLEFDKGEYALKQGKLAAEEKISQIKKVLKKKKR